MRYFFLLLASVPLMSSYAQLLIRQDKFEQRELLQYVDQHIGLLESACSFGVSLPFGSIRPCPHTPEGRPGYSDTGKITGFTIINNASVYRYGNFLISPQIGLDCWDDFAPTNHDSEKSDELLRPDYYKVRLAKFDIATEITSTAHSSIFRFTYPESRSGEASLVLYPSHALFSKSIFSTISFNAAINTISGYLSIDDGWHYSRDGKIYYVMQFEKPILNYGMFRNDERKLHEQSDTISGKGVGCYLRFSTSSNEKIQIKVAISTKSIENAAKFLSEEIHDWDFDKVQHKSANSWDRALSSILIDDDSISGDERNMFYTALYRSLIYPKDRTGDCPWNYSGSYYDDHICVWDTYRSEFPLLTLIKESVVSGTVRSFCEIFRHYGYAGDAFICGQNDLIQGGDNVDVLVADAYAKGLKGINWNDAYALLKGHATVSGRTPLYRENDRGWAAFNSIPILTKATASKTLEFAYNDYCAALVAKGLGRNTDKERFWKRSGRWTNLWDTTVINNGFKGFIQSKDSNNHFVAFDPEINPGPYSLHFYEASSWTYSFYVPHQMPKLIELMGGKDTFIKRLEFFANKHIDINNEQGFLTPYLFHYALRPDLSSFYVRKIAKSFTRNSYPGEDDSGAMSSWFIFTRLGFFPVAGQDIYLINGPRYQKVTIQMENGKKIVIYGKEASEENKYIESVTLNGRNLKNAWFKHKDIRSGAEFNFKMVSKATKWGQLLPPPSPTDNNM